MDNIFPSQLYPHLYLDGPPEEESKHNYGGWGSYERVRTVGAGPCDDEQAWARPEFEPQHATGAEEWLPVKPAVTPLMPAYEDAKVPSIDLPDPMDFPDHMQYFYQHYFMDAFPTMGHLLQDDLSFQRKRPKDALSMRWASDFVNGLKYKRCEYANFSKKIRCMHHLLRDIVSDVPPSLLSSLLHEELTTQRERLQFSSETTGGSLGLVPLHDDQSSRDYCLIYPRGVGMDKVFFHKVVEQFNDDKPPSFVMQPKSMLFYLSGTIRQISSGKMEDEGHVAVRSDYYCGLWVLGRMTKPRLVEVIETKDPFSCVSGSPHMPNEFVVVNERGAAYLWTGRRELQKFREESSNLYFNAKSSWRWCEFTSHPRVMVYADRTGAELTDMRSHENTHTLFRIGKTPGCVSGERVIIAKYMSKSHAHHHLINTQFSTYVMDERVPSVPMLKWNHMMESPPIFACDLPGQTPSQTSKLLLGSQRTQEIMLLQYSGGREHACQTQGPIQRLFNPKECLSHLSLQLPHKKHIAQKRLNTPVTGFAATHNKDYMSVFQLSETGDVFFQTLKLHADQTTTGKDVPEQAVSVEHAVETGETENFQINGDSQSSQSDSETEGNQLSETGRGFLQTLELHRVRTTTNKDIPKQAVSVERIVKNGHFKSRANSDVHSSQSDSETEGRQAALVHLEVIDNVDVDHLNASDTNKDIRKDPLSSSIGNKPTCSTRPPIPSKDPDLQATWNEWFKPIFKKASAKKRHSHFRRIRTDDLNGLKGKKPYKLVEDQLTRLRKDLQEVMRKKESLSHGVTYLPHLNVTPVPDSIDPDDWDDDLSQRLAASWEGNWKCWWEEKLGLNQSKKIAALRRKRQRLKQAKARHRISLSGSFTSSVKDQGSDFCLSSAGSQFLDSNDEGLEKSQSMDMEEWMSRSEMRKKSPIMLRRFLHDQSTVEEPGRSPIRSPLQSPLSSPDQGLLKSSKSQSSSRVKRPASSTPSVAVRMDSGPGPSSLNLKRRKDLNSLPASQTSTQNSAPDDGFSFSQFHLSSPTPSSRLSLSSQRLPQIRSSSKASQPKKKSRMGF